MSDSEDRAAALQRAMRVQTLLKEAQIERQRGAHKAAVAKVEEAIELAPEQPAIHEVLGDIHASSGHYAKAMAAYRNAIKLDPDRPETEEKLARASLGQLNFERKLALGEKLLAGQGTQKDMKRATNMATALSLLWPGGGQFLNGHYTKGAIMAIAHLVFVMLLLTVITESIRDAQHANIVRVDTSPYASARPKGLQGVGHTVTALKSQGRLGWVYLLMVLELTLYGWSVMDALVGAQHRDEDGYV